MHIFQNKISYKDAAPWKVLGFTSQCVPEHTRNLHAYDFEWLNCSMYTPLKCLPIFFLQCPSWKKCVCNYISGLYISKQVLMTKIKIQNKFKSKTANYSTKTYFLNNNYYIFERKYLKESVSQQKNEEIITLPKLQNL